MRAADGEQMGTGWLPCIRIKPNSGRKDKLDKFDKLSLLL
jgi:hypothetical protein